MMGRGQVAVLPSPQYLGLIGEQEPITIFVNLMANDPINLVLRKEVADQLGVSPAASLEDKLLALKGLKIGVAPGPITRIRMLFDSVGLDADEHVEIVTVGARGQLEFLRQATVEAIYAHTPYLETALADGALMFVDQSAGEVPKMTDGQYHVMLTTRAYADENPEVIEGLTRAIRRAQQLIHSDSDGTVAALIESGVVYENHDLLPAIVGIYGPAVPTTPEVSADKFLPELARYPAHQEAPDLTGIDLSEYVAK
jgi:NitT/TauT family transport system substrate-binding protein